MDADSAGGCSREVGDDADNVMSRTRMVIIYANCPVYWRGSLQMEIAVSSSETEYIAIFPAMREALPLMEITE